MEDITYTGTPDGYGDTFYIYAYDSTVLPLVSGTSYKNLRVNILDGDFILRWWRGCDLYANIAQGIQIRDRLQNQFFSDTLTPFLSSATSVLGSYMASGWPVLPEKYYPDQGYIGFDLQSALPNIAPNTSGIGQLAFYGVRRRKGLKSDPQTYTSPNYANDYQIQASPTIPAGWSSASGGFLVQIPVQDYDFEIMRWDGFQVGGGTAATLTYSGRT